VDLRVATYNLYLGADLSLVFGLDDEAALRERTAVVHGQLLATRFSDRARALAALLTRERPDLVGLQEVTTWTRAERVWCDFLAELVAALEDRGEPYHAHAVNPTFTGRGVVVDDTGRVEEMALTGGNAVLRRAASPWRVTDEGTASYDVELQVPTVAGTLVPIGRGWGWVEVGRSGRRVLVVSTHLEAYDARVRAAQRDALLGWMEPRAAGNRTAVVLGDLNATPGLVGMPAGWTDAWVAAGSGPGHTCCQDPDLANPATRLHERIDYVFVRGVAVRAARVVGDRPEDRTAAKDGARLWPSDHAAVVADVVVESPPSPTEE
jgi:endonuclease/exonuclease/phosphatase family metal-dependent hydrolase